MTRKSPFGYFFSNYGLLKSPIGDFEDLPRKFTQFWHEGSECNVEKVAIVAKLSPSPSSIQAGRSLELKPFSPHHHPTTTTDRKSRKSPQHNLKTNRIIINTSRSRSRSRSRSLALFSVLSSHPPPPTRESLFGSPIASNIGHMWYQSS